MRRLVQGINERIAGFVDQRDDLALVPVCDDSACPFLLKIVEEVDQGGSPHMFWMFAEAFEDEAAYVDAVAASFEGRHALVCDAFQKTGDTGLADGKRPEDQSPVRDRFITGNAQAALQGTAAAGSDGSNGGDGHGRSTWLGGGRQH